MRRVRGASHTRVPSLRRRWPRRAATGALLLAVLFGAGVTPAAAQAAPPPPSAASACDRLPPVVRQACGVGRNAVGAVASGAGNAASRMLVDPAQHSLVQFVVAGATWLVGKVLSLLDTQASPDLSGRGFAEAYQVTFGLGPIVMTFLLLLAIGDAVVHQRPTQIARAKACIPIAVLGTLITPTLLQLLIAATDQASAAIMTSTRADIHQFLNGLTTALQTAGGIFQFPFGGSAAPPALAVIIGALLVIFASLGLWLELLFRAQLIYLAAVFLPVAYAAIVWQRTHHYVLKLLKVIVALVIAKPFIMIAVMLGAKLVAHSGIQDAFNGVIIGAILLLTAMLVPFAILHVVNVLEVSVRGRSTLQAVAGQVPYVTSGVAQVKQTLSLRKLQKLATGGAQAAHRASGAVRAAGATAGGGPPAWVVQAVSAAFAAGHGTARAAAQAAAQRAQQSKVLLGPKGDPILTIPPPGGSPPRRPARVPGPPPSGPAPGNPPPRPRPSGGSHGKP